METSPSSDHHEQGGVSSNKHVTTALIMDCPTITVHMVKCYKALIDSGAAIPPARYSTYKNIDNSWKKSHAGNSDTTKYSGWISYDSVRNNDAPT